MSYPFSCSACGTNFALSDRVYENKVRGKVVTIGCRKCGADIRLDGRANTDEPHEAPPAGPRRSASVEAMASVRPPAATEEVAQPAARDASRVSTHPPAPDPANASKVAPHAPSEAAPPNEAAAAPAPAHPGSKPAPPTTTSRNPPRTPAGGRAGAPRIGVPRPGVSIPRPGSQSDAAVANRPVEDNEPVSGVAGPDERERSEEPSLEALAGENDNAFAGETEVAAATDTSTASDAPAIATEDARPEPTARSVEDDNAFVGESTPPASPDIAQTDRALLDDAGREPTDERTSLSGFPESTVDEAGRLSDPELEADMDDCALADELERTFSSAPPAREDSQAPTRGAESPAEDRAPAQALDSAAHRSAETLAPDYQDDAPERSAQDDEAWEAAAHEAEPAGASPRRRADADDADERPQERHAAAGPGPAPASPPGTSTASRAAIAALALAVVGSAVAWYALYADEPHRASSASPTLESPRPAAPDRGAARSNVPVASPQTRGEAPSREETASSSAGHPSAVNDEGSPTSDLRAAEGTEMAPSTPSAVDSEPAPATPGATQAPPTPGEPPAASTAPQLPGAPYTKVDAVEALRPQLLTAASCRRQGQPPGTAAAIVRFQPNGVVDYVRVVDPPYEATATGDCIAEALLGGTMHPFPGSEKVLRVPVPVK